MRSAKIELDARTDAVSFVLGDALPLGGSLPAESVGLAGLSRVEQRGRPWSESSSVRVRRNGHEARLHLQLPRIDAGTRVSVTHPSAGPDVSLSLLGGELSSSHPIEVTYEGPVQIAVPPSGVQLETPESPAVLRGVPVPEDVTIALAFPDEDTATSHRVFAGVEVTDLGFTSTELAGLGATTAWREGSALLEGTLLLEEVGGRSISLRIGEWLEFEGASGVLRSVELADGSLRVRFAGTVDEARIGAPGRARDLMPTWFEWLRVHHELPLLWGSVAAVFGVLASLVSWWRREA